ncbi:MAG: hypothetical protein JNM66_00390 [Bryobacterales bacterium]|nr:hypothetical protein [Bryobacterales bacterium]
MSITFESELMENQKHADVMAPEEQFEVLQSSDGDSLFFSIGTDGVFYLTREVIGDQTGWNRLDLSTGLGAAYGGGPVTAKAFDVSQNTATGNIDLALAVTAGGVDHLYLSRGHSNSDFAWAAGVTWTEVPFDDAANPQPALSIADVYIEQTPLGEYFVADVLKEPGSALRTVFRYYITPGAAPQWNAHDLAGNLEAGSITSYLGQRMGDPVAGMYTFGTIASEAQLVYAELFNPFSPGSAAAGVNLTMPAGATAIAVAIGATGYSTLLVAGTAGLYVFAPSNQKEGAAGVLAVADPLFAGARGMRAYSTGARTAVWGVNAQDQLIYSWCAAGQEAVSGAWATPVALLVGVEAVATYLNQHSNGSVLFAHTSGQNLVQLTQDMGTTEWHQRSILLPATSVDDMVSFQSFTTRIQVGDPGVTLQMTSDSTVPLYINDVYYVLSPAAAVAVQPDVTGVVTVLQETQALAAVKLTVTVAGTSETAKIDPMSKAMGTLQTFTSDQGATAGKLGALQVTDSKGNTKNLLPASATPDQVNALAGNLNTLVGVANQLPGGGTGATAAAAVTGAVPAGAKKLSAGDAWAWLKHAFEDVEKYFVQVVDDVYHFFLQIGEALYHFVLDTVTAIAHAIEFVFNKIAVFFEDLVKWLGFIFSWNDILRTHRVLKSMYKTYAKRAVGEIEGFKAQVDSFFSGVEGKLDEWAGMTVPSTQTVGEVQTANNSQPGSNSPQSHWALQHTQNNAGNATATVKGSSPAPGVLATLENLVSEAEQTIQGAFNQLKTQVIDQRDSLTATQLVQRVVDIVLKVLLETAREIFDAFLDILASLIGDAVDDLDAELKIPILSKIYKDISGDELSILDLACLIAAIPATIIAKLVTEEVPFPDSSQTDALIGATDFAAFSTALGGAPKMMLAAATPEAAAPASSKNLYNIFAIVTGAGALLASLGVGIVGKLRRELPKLNEGDAPTQKAKVLGTIATVIYLVYLGPSFLQAGGSEKGTLAVVWNDLLTGISVVKTIADNAALNTAWSNQLSPWLEFLLNMIWLAPPIMYVGAGHTLPSDIVSLIGNLAFDVGGMCTPFTNEDIVGAEAAAIVFAASVLLAIVYGGCSLGAGITAYEGH